MIRVQKEDFNLGTEYDSLIKADPNAGAIVSFIGRVRDFQVSAAERERGDSVQAITLEHYPGMTEKELTRIEAEAHKHWPLTASLIIHRYGRLEPGDQIVLVLTASSHRKAAFEAAEFLMDYLKTQAPFWKKEETQKSERWVEARHSDTVAKDRWAKERKEE